MDDKNLSSATDNVNVAITSNPLPLNTEEIPIQELTTAETASPEEPSRIKKFVNGY